MCVGVSPPAADQRDAAEDGGHGEDDQGQGGHGDVEHFKLYTHTDREAQTNTVVCSSLKRIEETEKLTIIPS